MLALKVWCHLKTQEMTRDVMQMAGRGKLLSRYETAYARVPGGYVNEAVEFLRQFSV